MFTKGQEVKCEFLGIGKVLSVDENFIMVDFDGKIALYDVDGRIIINGTPSPKSTLKPNSVTDKLGKALDDGNLVILRFPYERYIIATYKNGKFITNNEELSLNPSAYSIKIDLSYEQIEALKNLSIVAMKVVNNDKNQKDEQNEENQDNNSDSNYELQKTASEKQKDETYNEEEIKEIESVEIYFDPSFNAQIDNITDEKIIEKISDNRVKFKYREGKKERIGRVSFKFVKMGIETFVEIAGYSDKVAKYSHTDTNPKNYLEVFDAFAKYKEGRDIVQDQIPSDSIKMIKDEEGNIMITIGGI